MIRVKVQRNELIQLKNRIEGMPAAMNQLAATGSRRSAERLAEMVRSAILDQTLRLKALSPDWKEYKRRNNLDPRKLITDPENGYVSQIEVIPSKRGGYIVGTRWPYALIHEYGAPEIGVPARPHWRPTMRKWANGAQKDITPALRASVLSYLRQGKSHLAGDVVDVRGPSTFTRAKKAAERAASMVKKGLRKTSKAVKKATKTVNKVKKAVSGGSRKSAVEKLATDLAKRATGRRGGSK